MPDPRPRFDQEVAPGGYRWWYLDGLSEDGRSGLTIIVFVGSVFSPYYAWARRREVEPDPERFCAINVALYGRGGSRWAMTERSRSSLDRAEGRYALGPSRVERRESGLDYVVDERTAPSFRRLRGRVRVRFDALNATEWMLDPAGRHRWRPIAPRAQIEVDFERPALSWRGAGYLDANHGAEPLEEGFRRWSWSRGVHDGETVVLYDAIRRDGGRSLASLAFDAGATPRAIEDPPLRSLARTGWRIERDTRSDAPSPRLIETLEDTPFYARSLLETELCGARAIGFHESLDLDRFASPVVQAMLPFRMPRLAR